MHEAQANDNYFRWRARRGMHELDGVLVPFVSQNLAQLTAKERSGLFQLLEEEDPNLFSWLFQGAKVPEQHSQLIKRIKCFASTRAPG